MKTAIEILHEELTENLLNELKGRPFFEDFIIDAMISYSDIRVKEVNKWISVKDEMPDNRQTVIIYWTYEGTKRITSGSYNSNSDYWQHGAATQLNVTHWMPLPGEPILTTED